MTEILDFLKKNQLKNLNILNFIENNHIYGFVQIAESMLIRGRSDQDWVFISCSNKNDLPEIKKSLSEKDKYFAAVDDWMIPTLLGERKIIWKLELQQYYLPEDVKVPKPIHVVRNLNRDHAETVYINSDYKDYLSIDFIAERIQKDVSKGVFINDELVAWGLTHDDGALGYLHVKDKARRKGYGLSVMLGLINDVRAQGKIPFGCIEPSNKKSLGLVEKLGFIYQRNCSWLEIE